MALTGTIGSLHFSVKRFLFTPYVFIVFGFGGVREGDITEGLALEFDFKCCRVLSIGGIILFLNPNVLSYAAKTSGKPSYRTLLNKAHRLIMPRS